MVIYLDTIYKEYVEYYMAQKKCNIYLQYFGYIWTGNIRSMWNITWKKFRHSTHRNNGMDKSRKEVNKNKNSCCGI